MARPYVITIASEKGGVGKTTLATNLAIYLKGLAEDLPVTLFSFDNHFTIDQMFQLGKQPATGDVGDIFSGKALDELIMAGQYGAQFIPSSRDLFAVQQQISGVSQLAELLSSCQLGGVVIIDTSPIVDIYTRNALFAADRVIVPIKDAASLENCRHMADFLQQQQRPKSILRLLPCIVDTRIHFEGPFRNSYQLLKAYAINRGYKCLEGYIAKSPKVESLSTNPSGKLFPVITHGRNTDVHLQFMHLARQVYLDYLENGPTRMNQIAHDRQQQDTILERQRRERYSRIQKNCLCCNKPISQRIWPGAYYLESSNSKLAGFVEQNCFLDLIVEDCFGEQKAKGLQDSLRELLLETADNSYIMLQRSPLPEDEARIDFYRLDNVGEKISGRHIIIKEKGFFSRSQNSNLVKLFKKIADKAEDDMPQMLLAHRSSKDPLQLLEDQKYLEWQTVFARVQVDLTAEKTQ